VVFAFDARAAKALPAGGHLTFDGAPGLRLVATATRRTWTYRYKSPIDGGMKQLRLGHWPSMSAPAAFVAWEQARASRDAGTDPAADRRAERAQERAEVAQRRELKRTGVYTVRKLCDAYLGTYAGTVAPKTYAEAARLLGREIDAIAELPAEAITRAHAYGLLDGMRSRPVVAQQLRQHLGAAWDRALDAGELPPDAPNWWRLILRGKLPSQGKRVAGEAQGPTKRVLSDAEVGALLKWLPNFSRDVQDALTLYLWTLCRGAEIVAMERAELTTEKGVLWWTIPKAKLKMRRNPLLTDLRVPLVGRAEAVVKRRLEASQKPWLFPSIGKSGHVEQKAIGVAVWTHMPYSETRPEAVRPRLPVTHWAPHDLRRTGRTMLSALGCPERIAEAILGHIAPGVVGVYDRYQYDAERLLWLKKLSAKLEKLAR
jgi:integrase